MSGHVGDFLVLPKFFFLPEKLLRLTIDKTQMQKRLVHDVA